MKRREGLYFYELAWKAWVRCRVCEKFSVPVIEIDKMREHLIEDHPQDCYTCDSKHNCEQLFITRYDQKLHYQMIKLAGGR